MKLITKRMVLLSWAAILINKTITPKLGERGKINPFHGSLGARPQAEKRLARVGCRRLIGSYTNT